MFLQEHSSFPAPDVILLTLRHNSTLKPRTMLPSPVTDLKTFVPAKDAEVSKKFYVDLGFTINWSNDQIAELQIGSFRFLLQTFYVSEHAGNFMMSLAVDDADA